MAEGEEGRKDRERRQKTRMEEVMRDLEGEGWRVRLMSRIKVTRRVNEEGRAN